MTTLVEQYVHDRNGLYINIHTMTDALQKDDKNYSTIPKAEFRKSLQKILESMRRKQNASNGSRNESLSSSLSLSSMHRVNEIVQRKRPIKSECTVDCKRMCTDVSQMQTSVLNRSPSGVATNFDSLSERLRSDYVKRTSQTISRASALDGHEVHVPFSPVSTPCGLFVIDRNGDFDIDVCCNAQNDNLEPSIPVADAERPLQTTGPCKTSCAASVADRNLDSDSSEPVQKTAGKASSSSSKKLKRKNNLEDGDGGSIEKTRSFKVSESEVRFCNLGAPDTLLSEEDIEKIVTAKHPKGIIITGAKGTGKSTLAVAIVGELRLPYIAVTGVQLTNGRNGGREDFENLVDIATLNAPCAVVVENILHRYSNESSRMDDLMLARLQALFHEVNKEKALIWIIATASKLSSVEEDLLGKGWFEVRINLSLPKENARLEILKTLLSKNGASLSSDVDLQQIARNTPAYAPGDLVELIETGLRKAQLRMHKELDLAKSENERAEGDCWRAKYQNLPCEDEVAVTAADFEAAIKSIIPAARNQGHFIESTKVTWDDIGGLEHVRKQLETSFLRPIKYPLLCSHLGLTSRPVGVLLYGPPGCGKTLVAKALANEGSLSFMAINGPELFTKYVGESERNVREIFEKAEKSAPCVIYFDEIDSLCQRRESTEGGAKANVVNQILTELDGVESREQVYVVGSTNRIDCIDEALLRPGRFSKITEIKLPDGRQRFEILKALTKRAPQLAGDVDLEALALDRRCENLSGADLSGLVCAAAELCLEALSTEMDSLETRMKQGERIPVLVGKLHFENALEQLCNERTSRLKRRKFELGSVI